MNQIACHQQTLQTYSFPDQRGSKRHLAIHLLAITPKGTGQIIDISGTGLSLGCLYPHYFQNEWRLDILDAKGSHIKRLKVRKIWQKDNNTETSSEFEMEIGIEFLELTQNQIQELDILIDNINVIDPRYHW